MAKARHRFTAVKKITLVTCSLVSTSLHRSSVPNIFIRLEIHLNEEFFSAGPFAVALFVVVFYCHCIWPCNASFCSPLSLCSVVSSCTPGDTMDDLPLLLSIRCDRIFAQVFSCESWRCPRYHVAIFFSAWHFTFLHPFLLALTLYLSIPLLS